MRSSRRRSAPVVNGLFVFTLILLGYLGAIGFGMVWFRHQISITANANHALEQQMREVQREVNEVSAEIAYALNPEELIQKNAQFRLQLVRPSEQQVFRVTDDVERRLAGKRFDQRFYTINGDGPGGVASAANSTSP
jgi:cell division protein FtsB